MKIQSYNEWDTLKSVVVGTATDANFPTDVLSQLMMESGGWTKSKPPSGPVPQYIIDETNEDLDILSDTLTSLGIEVRRTFAALDFQKQNGQYAYCPRDNLLVVGDRVIEAPMVNNARQNERNCFYTIRCDAINDGARWISAPLPEMFYGENELDGKFKLNNEEPAFDAANICRFGNNLIYLVSSTGNKIGAEWLQNVLTDIYQVHTIDVYDSAHIDSTIVPIDYGHVVLNANRVNDDNLPDFLKDWNKIYITEDMINPQSFIDYPYASKWIAINMLALGNKKVVCDKNQPKIIAELEKNGFEPVPLQLRHARTLGGGFHCVTLDLHREPNSR